MNDGEIIREAIVFTEIWRERHQLKKSQIWTRKAFIKFTDKLLSILKDEVF